ncbi:MAG: c-type cytochrome biogenesis protein CcmI [Zoogloeaceae bacterium]|jgi:cytochrome c-type biogenesis protein CcmH|nr:c-type cytochrome biogenesis protein CcmI [Zoogloeaceae bacterium]
MSILTFSLAALTLIFVVCALLLPSLLRPSRATQEKSAVNLDILREQLAELASERAAGRLTESALIEAQTELKRRILEESASPAAQVAAPFAPSPKTAIALTLLLVVSSVALYGALGQPLALLPEIQNAQRADAAKDSMSAEELRVAVERITAHLEKNPEDTKGWIMLARAYKILERPADAAAAYARIEEKIDGDADLLADYAEMLAMSSETRMQGKPQALAEQALKLNPQHAHALFLAGMAALEAGKKQEAAAYWEKLLPMVEPGSELRRILSDNIRKFRAAPGDGK